MVWGKRGREDRKGKQTGRSAKIQAHNGSQKLSEREGREESIDLIDFNLTEEEGAYRT